MLFKIGAFKKFAIFLRKTCVLESPTHVFMACTSPPPTWGWKGGLIFLEKSLLMGSKIFILLGEGGILLGGGGVSHNFEVKIKIA